MESDKRNLIENDNSAVESSSAQQDTLTVRKKLDLSIEFPVFVLFFAWILSDNLITTQILKQTCLYVYGFNETVCSQLSGNHKITPLEELIQPYVSKLTMTSTMMRTILPAFMTLFVGPWSQKYGRKPVLITTFIGYTLTLITVTALSYLTEFVPSINPWYFVIAHLPMSLLGGLSCMMVAVFCYSADVSDPSHRSLKIGIIETVIFAGVGFGSFFTNPILALTNTTSVFLVSTLSVFVATLYVILFVKESVDVTPEAKEDKCCHKLRELFVVLEVFKNMWKTCVQQRPFKEKYILWSLITILTLSFLTMDGTIPVYFLFLREKMKWTIAQCSLYESAAVGMTIAGSIFGLVVLKKMLKVPDTHIAVISLVSLILESTLKTFAYLPWHFYAISGICLFKNLFSPMLRSMVSRLVPVKEIGKTFAIVAFLQAFAALPGAPIYRYIYSKTLTTFPGAFQLITAGLYSINLILAICVITMKKSRDNSTN